MMRYIIPIFAIFFLWRIFLFLPLFVAQKIPYRSGYDYTNIWKFTKQYEPVKSPFLYPWANFDGVYYLYIAGSGYTKDNSGFFPLYPITISIASSVLRGAKTFGALQFFIAFFLANSFLFLNLVVLYKLLRLDYSHKISISALLFLLIFPASFFLGAIYSESLFLLLSALSFYFARKKQWLEACIFASLLTATRFVGIAILPALFYEFYSQEKTFKKINLLPLFFIPIGLFSYAWFNLQQWKNPLNFLYAHTNLGNGRVASIILFPQTIFRYLKILLSTSFYQYEWWIALLEFFTFFLISYLLFLVWRDKIRRSYFIFAFFSFLIPVSSGTFSAVIRYSVILFPIFIALALLKNKVFKFMYIFVSIILLFILLVLFSRGFFVA